MVALRKVVDSNILNDVLDLPPAYKNKKVEIILFPVEEKKLPHLTMEQINEWAETSSIRSLVGALKSTGLSENTNLSDIRNERLSEKYSI